MDKSQTSQELARVRVARREWLDAKRKFDGDLDYVVTRLINEAMRNGMSAEAVAEESGFTIKRVRELMRKNGFNPRWGKKLLSDRAARNMEDNAEIMGVDPQDIDLTSPLAYLPSGKKMRSDIHEIDIARGFED